MKHEDTSDQLAVTITKLREAAAKAQTEGFNLDLHLGRSRAYATAHAHRWSVSVKAGDLLRILDAAEQSLKQAEVASQALPEKGDKSNEQTRRKRPD